MSFDKPTRNALASMVGDCRRLLTDDIRDQLQAVYGLQPDGTALPVARLTHLDEHGYEVARALREWQEHLASTEAGTDTEKKKKAFDRLAHETAFTVLNRLAALRMCEERGHVIECVGRGMESDGFALYERFSGGALGTRGETYQIFLERMFDELAVDLGALFDLRAPQSLVFPREPCLEKVLALLNDSKLAHLWKEDETIGWVYQYFNSKEEREKMREESAAPRNSRELAVRNQFFTPRYVVEFLVDNTLGRLWYGVRKGKTTLVDSCRYLVRRKHPSFLDPGQQASEPFSTGRGVDPTEVDEMWTRPCPDGKDLSAVWRYALTVNGYDFSKKNFNRECGDLANERIGEYQETKKWRGSFEELRCCLFFEQRRYHHFGYGPEGDEVVAIQDLYKSICERWEFETESVPHRPKKDPRDLKILDPACGSGHFLLYCYDLLETIYEEAWIDEQPATSETNGKSLREDFPDLDSLRKALPELILRHNLHGIDIDLRACQIAALALWLRAQRSYERLGLKRGDRPKITKSNTVCAEPMPGEQQFLDQFLAVLEPKVIGQLVQVVFEKMKLAGEAGSLLKIEEEIAGAVTKAKKQWVAGPKAEQGRLFADDRRPEQKELGLDFSGITDATFWEKAEERIYAALQAYAEHAENGPGYQRRLFADDAARGFAFIDLCRKRYDVALMNPPFRLSQGELYTYLNHEYPDSFIDLLASFIVRAETMAHAGFVGAITSRACLYTKTLLDWRTTHLSGRISALVDMGIGVLDGAMVRSCAYVIPVGQSSVNGCFIDARRHEPKDADILSSIQAAASGKVSGAPIYWCDSAFFDFIPQRRVLYWLPRNFWEQIHNLPAIEPLAGTIRAGLTTYDDERFLRLRWEIAPADLRERAWMFLSKGGYFGTFYNDVHLVVLWAENGKEVGEYNRSLYGTDAQSRRGSAYYLRPAVTYSRRTDYFSAKALPENCFFADKGPAIIPLNSTTPAYLLGVFSSDLFRGLVHSQSQGGCFETGVLKHLPWTEPDAAVREDVETAARAGWTIKFCVFRRFETDARFAAPVFHPESSIDACYSNAVEEVSRANLDVAAKALEISTHVSKLFGLSSDRFEELDVFETDHDIKEAAEILQTPAAFSGAIISFALGCTFGRWDIRFATGEKPAPELPDPFDPLPVCPPGMLQNEQGLPLTQDDVRRLQASGQWHYPLDIPWDGILVDDSGVDGSQPHCDDIVRRIRQLLTLIWKDRAEAIEQEACQILGVKDLREYFRKPALFFADHLKRYSKSRRQAPIYWPLSTAWGSYTLWIYYHRLNDDLLHAALVKYVKPKIDEVERKLRQIESDLPNATGREASRLRDAFEDTKAFLEELREFRDELQRVAALPYKPNLNDGVLITASPLWKLFRLPKWRKDLVECWKKLEAGEYDWAHLAYSIWPDRVREVCKHDRSIAIAHGLEELCEVAVKPTKKKRAKKAEVKEAVLGEEA